ncbi:MAG: hypothetical protein WAN05_25225, partial [Roseiarcus sp.]
TATATATAIAICYRVCTLANSAHDHAKYRARIEKQLATHNGAESASISSLRSSDGEIIPSSRRQYERTRVYDLGIRIA